jgi:hypothetical protein
MTTVIESFSTVAINTGKKISFDKANASQQRFWDAVTNENIGAANCPRLSLFSLSALQQYLGEIQAEFERLGIPEKDRGVAVMPVMHNGEQRFNILFTPCVQDEQGNCYHQFTANDPGVGISPDWTLPGLNEGGLTP